MVSIHTNLSSLIAQGSLTKSTNTLNRAIEQMSTGYKINHASDNAANYSIKTNMDTKIGAYQVAEDNAMMGLDMLQTAESSLNQISDKLSRLRALAVTAQNGTYGTSAINALESEAETLVSEIQRAYLNCKYNGIDLFKTDLNTTNVDPQKRVVNQTTFISGETYFIKDSLDLVKLQDLVNSGVDTAGVFFELTNDIDMSGISFRGIGVDATNCFKGFFDGKEHVITNLNIETTESNVGLFGYIYNASVVNVGLRDCDIKGKNAVGGIVGVASANSTVKDSFCFGEVIANTSVGGCVGESSNSSMYNLCFDGDVVAKSAGAAVGGVVGRGRLGGSIKKCYSNGTLTSTGGGYVGGILGVSLDGCRVLNCFSRMDILDTTATNCGGVVGYYTGTPSLCCSSGSVNGVSPGNLVGNNTIANNLLTYEEMGFTEGNGWKIVNEELRLIWYKDSLFNLAGQHEITLHIASTSKSSAEIGFDISFDLSSVSDILTNGINSEDVIFSIDTLLNMLSSKSIEYGSVQNRLMSVLDEINVQYENLVSSRSTIQDADMGEVSATYIQQQILQQASATLMATANQTPAIALQLL